MRAPEPMVEIHRGPFVESQHMGHAVICDGSGHVHFSLLHECAQWCSCRGRAGTHLQPRSATPAASPSARASLTMTDLLPATTGPLMMVAPSLRRVVASVPHSRPPGCASATPTIVRSAESIWLIGDGGTTSHCLLEGGRVAGGLGTVGSKDFRASSGARRVPRRQGGEKGM